MSSAPLDGHESSTALYAAPSGFKDSRPQLYFRHDAHCSTTSISVASVEAIRARFPALTRRYEEPPGRLLRRPAAARRCRPRRGPDDRLPAAPQRQHALALSDQPRDRRGARRRPRRARRLPQRVAERDCVRQQHDDDHLPRRARARPRLGQRRRDRRHRAGPPRQRRALARAGARARRHRPHRAAATPRPASSTGTTSSARVGPKTRLVAMGAASNALGTISDVAPRRATWRTPQAA